MLQSLEIAFRNLLKDAYPAVFDGDPAPVSLRFPPHEWTFDALSADATAGEPTPDDAADLFPFDPDDPAGPYTLSHVPYPGPRRVYLRSATAERVTLGPAEVAWEPTDARIFTLNPKPTRVLTGLEQVQVLYGVTGVFTKLKTSHQLSVLLTANDEAAAERAELLAMAAFALARGVMLQTSAFYTSEGDYEARGEIKSLKLVGGASTSAKVRRMTLAAEVELKVSRALREDEGTPIERIGSPGVAPNGRPVNVRIDVEA
jgi:hypothetical protein